MQALVQAIDFELGLAIDIPKATLAVKRSLASTVLLYVCFVLCQVVLLQLAVASRVSRAVVGSPASLTTKQRRVAVRVRQAGVHGKCTVVITPGAARTGCPGLSHTTTTLGFLHAGH